MHFNSGRARFLTCIVAMALCALGAVLALQQSFDTGKAGPYPNPQLVLMVNKPGVSVQYNIAYSRGSYTGPGQTTFSSARQSLPLGVRDVTLSFTAPRNVFQLGYALLLNSDARVYNATSPYGFGTVASTPPGTVLSSACPDVANFQTAQVLSGTTPVFRGGHAEVSVIGGIQRGLTYPEQNDRLDVSVMSLVPSAADGLASPGRERCAIAVPDWDQIGGQRWYTPAVGRGEVDIGALPGGYSVENANPSLASPAALDWTVQGPVPISYVLLDSHRQHTDATWALFAGTLAALAVSFLAALVTGAYRPLLTRREAERLESFLAAAAQPPARASPHPHRNKQAANAIGRALGCVVVVQALIRRRSPRSRG